MKAPLQLTHAVVADAHVGELSEAVVDAVTRAAAGERALDRPPPGGHPLTRRRREGGAGASERHARERFEGERGAVELDRFTGGGAPRMRAGRHFPDFSPLIVGALSAQ